MNLNLNLQPHQQRVVDEKSELDDKIQKLDQFITTNPFFDKLDAAERGRLIRQISAMSTYSTILSERIAAF